MEELLKDFQDLLAIVQKLNGELVTLVQINEYFVALEGGLTPKKPKCVPEPKAPEKPKTPRKRVDPGKIIALYEAGWLMEEIINDTGYSRSAVYKAVKDYREKEKIKHGN